MHDTDTLSRKDKILHAATRLFAYKGFADSSVGELAQLSGVAEGTIFYHFGNKEKLFVAVLANVRATVIREFESHIAAQQYPDGMSMMEGVVGFYLYLASLMEDAFLLLHRHYPYAMAQENAACREHLEAIYNCLADIFEEPIRRGLADGTMGGVAPRKAALLLFTMVDGLVRFKTYNLYDAGSLVGELMRACRKVLGPEDAS